MPRKTTERMARFNLFIPASLLDEIEHRVGKGNLAKFIREAIREKLEYETQNESTARLS